MTTREPKGESTHSAIFIMHVSCVVFSIEIPPTYLTQSKNWGTAWLCLGLLWGRVVEAFVCVSNSRCRYATAEVRVNPGATAEGGGTPQHSITRLTALTSGMIPKLVN